MLMAIATAMKPTVRRSCFAGTRPMIIMKKTVMLSNTAVDKFSRNINGTNIAQMVNM